MIITRVKSIVKLIYRPYLYIKYSVPLFCKYKNKKYRTLIDVLDGVSSVAIIGRGASIRGCNPIAEVSKADFVIIMNRVEIETLEEYIGSRINAQIAQPPPPYAVLSKTIIKK